MMFSRIDQHAFAKTVAGFLSLTALGLGADPVPVALTFGPVNVPAGHSLRLCVSNMFGDALLPVRFQFVDASTGLTVKYQDAVIKVGECTCVTHEVTDTRTPTPTVANDETAA